MENYLRSTKIVSALVMIFLVTSAALAIFIILFGDFDGTEVKILLSAIAFCGCGILSLPGLNLIERGTFKSIGKVAAGTSGLFLVLVLFLIWTGDVVSENLYFKVTATVFVISISSNHSALLLLSRSKNKVVSGCKWATISLIIVVALMLIYIVWGEDLPEALHRPLAVIVILDVLGTLSLPALNRFMGKHK